MFSKSYRPRYLYAFLIIPMLLGANDGKGCCGKADPPDTGNPPPEVESTLQVVSIEPTTVDANQTFTASIFGAGFKSGATVAAGPTYATSVSVTKETELKATFPGMPEGTYDIKVTNTDGESAKLRSGLTVKNAFGDCAFVRVNFDFDDAGLTGSAKSSLDTHMKCFQASPGNIRIEGHADERGTTEYNLALGARRAETVKRYLGTNGVSNSRVQTVSYGEERPVASGHSEASWAQNRRADLHVQE